METIINYLDTMFLPLPKTSEIEKIKNDLLYNMEDKYNELKLDGKTENEAIGIVISEFGNIDELINELNIPINNTKDNISNSEYPTLEITDVNTYLKDRKFAFFLISIGVFLCITAGALLILLSTLIEENIILSGFSENLLDAVIIVPLFILIVPAIALFIYSAFKLEKYKFIEDGNFMFSSNSKLIFKNQYEKIRPKLIIAIIIGVCLCVISPLSIILGSIISDVASTFGVIILLFIVGIAIFLFINAGSLIGTYKMLLQIDEYSVEKRKSNKIIGAVASVFWPIIICVYLFISFVYRNWYISWLIFPIAGILFGSFSAVCNIFSKTK